MGKRRQVDLWLSDWIEANRVTVDGHLPLYARPIICPRGLMFSVQASEFHYSVPRRNTGPYQRVEVGFPNRKIREFLRYAEDRKHPRNTVYGWVPVHVVEKVINKYGGVSHV